MNKYLIVLILVLISFRIHAEDTVRYGDGRYMYGNLPELIWMPCGDDDQSLGAGYYSFYDAAGVPSGKATMADKYWSAGTPIYGIAAWLNDVDCEVNARLYQLSNGIVTVVDTCNGVKNIKNHEFIVNHKVQSYVDSNNHVTFDTIHGTFPLIFSSYEFFFDSAINVIDTFFIGIYNNVPCGTTKLLCAARWDIPEQYQREFPSLYSLIPDTASNTILQFSSSSNNRWFWGGIFPIIVPDTTLEIDTTAVEMVDGVGRYVSLTPNPAADRVQVLSSFGLKQVEAYNSEGRLVYADEAHGLSKTIDLAAWPRGIYLVRVITPMGSTTKKLVLR